MRPGAIDLRQLDSRLRGNDEISRSLGGRRNVGCKLTLANIAKAQAAPTLSAAQAPSPIDMSASSS